MSVLFLVTFFLFLVVFVDQLKPSGVKLPVRFGPALRELFSPPGRSLRLSEVALPSDEDRQCVLTTLWAEGLVTVCCED